MTPLIKSPPTMVRDTTLSLHSSIHSSISTFVSSHSVWRGPVFQTPTPFHETLQTLDPAKSFSTEAPSEINIAGHIFLEARFRFFSVTEIYAHAMLKTASLLA